MDIKNSKFMADCSQNGKGKEAILSFQISWILRCAADPDIYQSHPILYKKCREMLFTLLNFDNSLNSNNINVLEVKVWKEWYDIDVLAKIKLSINGNQPEMHVLLVENKIYTALAPQQRDDYPKKVKDKIKNFKYSQLHQVVISCLEPNNIKYRDLQTFCEGTEWRVLNYEDLVNWNTDELTESDLFNEFWYATWDPIKE